VPFLGSEVAPRDLAGEALPREYVGWPLERVRQQGVSNRPFGSKATSGTAPGYGGNGSPNRLRYRRSHRLAVARIWGGIHSRFSTQTRSRMGAEVAEYVTRTQLRRLDGCG
jgi:hypothetical protein